MAKTRLIGVIFCCIVASAVRAEETSSPTLLVTPAQPKWSDLTVPQRIVLAPLSDDWDSFENFRQKKWLGIAARFPGLAQEEQRRIQKQMQEWGKLTPEQRKIARENYKAAKQLPIEKKQELKQKWEEYASLPSSSPALKPILPAAVPAPVTPAPVFPVTDALPATTPPASTDTAPKP